MRKINPAVHETLNFEAEIFSSTYALYRKELKQVRDAITVEENRRWVLSIPKMLSLRINAAIFFDLISPYGFTYTDAMNIISCLQAESGRIFYSSQFALLKDRHTVIIEKFNRNEENHEYEIPEHLTALDYPLKLTFTKIKRTATFQLPTSPDNIALDADIVHFPLKVRKWLPGDYFVPLGMTGKKKLSDFFIDRKINIIEKEKIWLLLSKGDIIWIIGHQIDNRYKVNPHTENLLMISLKD
jgi:tRNA(Ile)-lysidine synthase